MEYFFCSARLYVYLLCVSKGGPLVAMWWPTGAYYAYQWATLTPVIKVYPVSIFRYIETSNKDIPIAQGLLYAFIYIKY